MVKYLAGRPVKVDGSYQVNGYPPGYFWVQIEGSEAPVTVLNRAVNLDPEMKVLITEIDGRLEIVRQSPDWDGIFLKPTSDRYGNID